ncbi:MAG: hypothetical protein [Caudoviricetes sp.]|nr:MAG: hypothetical protein [Caudoviricetes sp.]
MKFIILLFFMIIPFNLLHAEINPYAEEFIKSKINNADIQHVMLIDNKNCDISIDKKDTTSKETCDSTSLAVSEITHDNKTFNFAYIQFYNGNYQPITIIGTPSNDNYKNNNLLLDIQMIYINNHLYDTVGSCTAYSEGGAINCNITIDKIKMKFDGNGGDKYLIK